MGQVNEYVSRPNNIPDADIDALMAQIRLRVRGSNQSPAASPIEAVEEAGSEEGLPSAEANGSNDLQAQFNAAVTQTLSILAEQIQQIQRNLAVIAASPPVRSSSMANGAAPYETRASDVAGASTMPYGAKMPNDASASNGDRNGS